MINIDRITPYERLSFRNVRREFSFDLFLFVIFVGGVSACLTLL